MQACALSAAENMARPVSTCHVRPPSKSSTTPVSRHLVRVEAVSSLRYAFLRPAERPATRPVVGSHQETPCQKPRKLVPCAVSVFLHRASQNDFVAYPPGNRSKCECFLPPLSLRYQAFIAYSKRMTKACRAWASPSGSRCRRGRTNGSVMEFQQAATQQFDKTSARFLVGHTLTVIGSLATLLNPCASPSKFQVTLPPPVFTHFSLLCFLLSQLCPVLVFARTQAKSSLLKVPGALLWHHSLASPAHHKIRISFRINAYH